MRLLAVLERDGITQSELARGAGRSVALISRIVREEVDPSRDTIDAILAFLTARLGRPVTYEECFGAPAAADVVAAEAEAR